MEIRCPKCRYRFEEAIPPYSSEHQCVCPRCGTPFLYTPPASEEQDDSIATPQQPTGSVPPEPLLSAGSDDLCARENVPDLPERGRTQGEIPSADRAAGFRRPHTSAYRRQRANRHSGNKWLLVIFLAVLAAFVAGIVLVGHLLNSDADVSPLPDGSVSNTEGEMLIDSLDGIFCDDGNVPALPTPQWVQGKWTARTEYGGIVVVIRGNSITEADGAYRLSGTFVCKGQKLVCDYGKGNIFTYHLNPSARTIDCGKGVVMRKAK